MRNTNTRQITRLCAALSITVSLLAVSTASAVITAVPTGLSAGDSYRLVVITYGKTNATSSDINYYNTFVNDDIAANGVEGIKDITGWTAIVSTSIDARDNTSTNNTLETGVPIYNLNDEILASNYGDFWDGSLDVEIGYASTGIYWDDYLFPDNGDEAWTGTDPDGTVGGGGLGVSFGQSGNGGSSGSEWIAANAIGNTVLSKLYAISPLLTVPPVPEPSSTALLGLGGLALMLRRRR